MDVEVGAAALGGRFSTVEGILTAMAEQLADNSQMWHDSADTEAAKRMESFMDKFRKVLAGDIPVTLILDDPAGNSYVQVSFYYYASIRIFQGMADNFFFLVVYGTGSRPSLEDYFLREVFRAERGVRSK